MNFNTPLRYPGGKGKLTDFIKMVFEQNSLLDGHYAEPYAGGAGVAINLLLSDYASCIHLNDLNRSIYAFWHSVIYEPEALCKKIQDVRVTMDEWYKQKAVQIDREASLLDLGFSTFFLNRTNRSGIILGGVIGGKGQTGEWKIDARFNKKDLCKRIDTIALYSNRIKIYNLDAVDFINKIIPALPEKSLIYLDPPYYVKGQDLYENHYKHDDHVKVSKLVYSKIKHPWIVSYDFDENISKLYSKYRSLNYGINYSAQDRYKGAEVMFFNDGVRIPDVATPVGRQVA